MAEEKKSSRTYHVLKQVTHPAADWGHVADIEASGPSQAIRLCVVDFGGGTYVAVPDGNWTEETYKSEPQPPKITKVESGWKWDGKQPLDPATAAVVEEQEHSVAVGEQDTIDDEDVDRAAIRRAAAAQKQ